MRTVPGSPLDVDASPGSAPASPFVEVALPVPLRQTFTYRVPSRWIGTLSLGRLVRVPFGRRVVSGFVVGFADDTSVAAIKEIADIEDEDLSIPADVLELGLWVSDYYLAPLGEVLRAALPAGLGKKSPGELPPAEGRLPSITLGRDQGLALESILSALEETDPVTVLLHGVTGSGKTEVYLRAAERAVAAGGKVLVLVPEIALSPQMVGRVEDRFGTRVALWHSALPPRRRREVWTRTRRGEIDVLVGARSAVFAPIPDLALIVVDEEHESAYKQTETPRYHARDVAVVRAQRARAVAVLGSATPSLESFHNAQRGKYRLLTLPERVGGRSRSPVELVPPPRRDTRIRPVSDILSDTLREAIAETLSRKEQGILFLNRRGHSTVVQCEDCREPLSCSSCDIVLTWHAVGDRLLCHYCGRVRTRPPRCPGCGGSVSVFKGVGTQKVESELHRLFSGLRLVRLDTDSTRKRGVLEATLDAFRRREADLLLGTQMVAKGLDFPHVTLVGVVNADLGLALPDFRSAERTFQLLTQVAGRSGRGDLPGRVLFQTNHPDHPALIAAAAQDYQTFYEAETEARRDPPYPPFRRLINLMLDGRTEERVIERSEEVAAYLTSRSEEGRHRVEILGPAPQPFSRLKGKHRWHVTLRGEHPPTLHDLAEAALDRFGSGGAPVRLAVDVDPVSLL